jgi:hypothetical protein
MLLSLERLQISMLHEDPRIRHVLHFFFTKVTNLFANMGEAIFNVYMILNWLLLCFHLMNL